MSRSASSTSCPSSASRRAASSAAATQSGWGATVLTKGRLVSAMRRRPGGAPTSAANGRATGGAQYGEVGSGPAIASSIAALSRTLRDTTFAMAKPPQCCVWSGPTGVRPRVGFSPNSPQHDAGIRIEPPPSLACATGKMPAATAAAAPPLEPPGVTSRFQGLRVGPNSFGSVNGVMPNSGVLVLPKMTAPARRKRSTSVESRAGLKSARNRLPAVCGTPAIAASRSLSSSGTPRNGASEAGSAAASRRACS